MKPKKQPPPSAAPQPHTVTITLTDLELGQVLDGLDQRFEAWRNTAEYHRTGMTPTDFFIAEECNGEYEAQSIADIYTAIIAKIRAQRDAQR